MTDTLRAFRETLERTLLEAGFSDDEIKVAADALMPPISAALTPLLREARVMIAAQELRIIELQAALAEQDAQIAALQTKLDRLRERINALGRHYVSPLAIKALLRDPSPRPRRRRRADA